VSGKEHHPRGRDFALRGATYRFATEAGDLYVTVNRNGDGRPFEAFITIGKSGSTLESLAEALGRLVSLALRSGIPPEEVARQLRGIKSVQTRQPPGTPVQAVDSIPDAVARALELETADDGRAPTQEDRHEPAPAADPGMGGLFLDLGHKTDKV
ncbi:MAG: adenosylcobalamin-dependent ribonucleoside-diphosphate reductase, partial [Conexivisphaera sp.]